MRLNKEEFNRLLENTKKTKYKTAFLLGSIGFKISQIIRIEKHQIDLKKRLISIPILKKGIIIHTSFYNLPKDFKEENLEYIPLNCGKRIIEINFKTALNKAGLSNVKFSDIIIKW